MDLGLQGKRALITGSTAGIGFAAARALAAEGAQVTTNGRTAARVNAAVARLKADLPGASVTGVSADLGTAAGCEVMIQQRPELDMLVNSMGIFEPKAFEEISDADWLQGSFLPTDSCFTRSGETNYITLTHYLRIYVMQLRQKIEPDPTRPRLLLTEPGLGYRFKAD